MPDRSPTDLARRLREAADDVGATTHPMCFEFPNTTREVVDLLREAAGELEKQQSDLAEAKEALRLIDAEIRDGGTVGAIARTAPAASEWPEDAERAFCRWDDFDMTRITVVKAKDYDSLRTFAQQMQREDSQLRRVIERGTPISEYERRQSEQVDRLTAKCREHEDFISEQVSDALDPSVSVPWMRCSPGLPAYVAGLEREVERVKADQQKLVDSLIEERLAKVAAERALEEARALLTEAAPLILECVKSGVPVSGLGTLHARIVAQPTLTTARLAGGDK